MSWNVRRLSSLSGPAVMTRQVHLLSPSIPFDRQPAAVIIRTSFLCPWSESMPGTRNTQWILTGESFLKMHPSRLEWLWSINTGAFKPPPGTCWHRYCFFFSPLRVNIIWFLFGLFTGLAEHRLPNALHWVKKRDARAPFTSLQGQVQ